TSFKDGWRGAGNARRRSGCQIDDGVTAFKGRRESGCVLGIGPYRNNGRTETGHRRKTAIGTHDGTHLGAPTQHKVLDEARADKSTCSDDRNRPHLCTRPMKRPVGSVLAVIKPRYRKRLG